MTKIILLIAAGIGVLWFALSKKQPVAKATGKTNTGTATRPDNISVNITGRANPVTSAAQFNSTAAYIGAGAAAVKAISTVANNYWNTPKNINGQQNGFQSPASNPNPGNSNFDFFNGATPQQFNDSFTQASDLNQLNSFDTSPFAADAISSFDSIGADSAIADASIADFAFV